MRWPRILLSAALALALATGAALVATGGSTAAPTESQELFGKLLLDDDDTTSAVKKLLEDGGGFVAPEILFSDLTGDGRRDAVVLVDTGGVAGAVALYLFSTHGRAEDSKLRAVYRNQRLYRASAATEGSTLTLRTPRFAEGDDVCCPAKVVERVYEWSEAKDTLVRRSSREVDGPTG